MDNDLKRHESEGGTVTYVLKKQKSESRIENRFIEPIKKQLFLVKHTKNNNEDCRTLLEIINDTESGVPIAITKDKRLEDHIGIVGNRKSSNISNSQSSDFLSIKTERDKDTSNLMKPRVIIENGKVRIEKPNMMEISQKLQEEHKKTAFVEYNDKSKISSLSFKKRLHSDKWDEDETDFFYKCLEYFGTDFSVLEVVLTPRTRNQIKNKYRKEEKSNSKKVETALKKFNPTRLYKLLTVIKNLQMRRGGSVDFKKLLSDECVINQDEFNKQMDTLMKEGNKDSVTESEEEYEGEDEVDKEENDDKDLELEDEEYAKLNVKKVEVDNKNEEFKPNLMKVELDMLANFK
jgi:hypothetical protein